MVRRRMGLHSLGESPGGDVPGAIDASALPGGAWIDARLDILGKRCGGTDIRLDIAGLEP